MAVKGKAREQKPDFVKELYTGFAQVRVVAINPTRDELNKLFGKTEESEKDELVYLRKDKDGNEYLELTFWLRDEDSDKHFIQSIKLYNEERVSRDGKKVQIINSTCGTSWVPFKLDKKGNPTNVADEMLIQDWFLDYTNKDKEVVGQKNWRKAIRGEEELGILLRTWLSMDWNDPETEVMVDIKKLFAGDLKDLKDMIGDGVFAKSFVILTGVRTNENDSTKKYQAIFSKSYLPSGFMTYIRDGNRFPSDYTKRVWKKFTDTVSDQYGFTCFHKLVPLQVYNEKEDPVGTNAGRPQMKPAENEY